MNSAQVPFVGNYNFLVEIDGITGDSSMVVGGFSQVSGLGSETEVIEHFVGNASAPIRVPGRTRYSNVVLTRGVTNSNELYRWRRSVEQGHDDRRSGSIILLDASMNERARWNFFDAWPCRYEAPELDAAGNAVSIETLELSVGRLERVDSE
jgi:phage tail-like protein